MGKCGGRKKKLGSGSDISKEERIGWQKKSLTISFTSRLSLACEEAQGICATLLVLCSLLLVFATLPLSLCFVIKVVQVFDFVTL